MNGITATTSLDVAAAKAAVTEALAEQGFGVLTEIDIAATLKAKLDVDRPAMTILGACNPSLAHAALSHDPSVAQLLPCNVVVEERDGTTLVTAVDPRELMDDPALADLAGDAATRLQAALDALPS